MSASRVTSLARGTLTVSQDPESGPRHNTLAESNMGNCIGIPTGPHEDEDSDDMIYPSEYSNFIGDIWEVAMIQQPLTSAVCAAPVVAGVAPHVAPVPAPVANKLETDPPATIMVGQDAVSLSTLLTSSIAPENPAVPRQLSLQKQVQQQSHHYQHLHHLQPQPEEEEHCITVGLSQVTLFPSHTLKIEETDGWFVPDTECLQLTLCSMCFDEEQMINSLRTLDKVKKKVYVPPPVTWSHPVIIVPPEEEEEESNIHSAVNGKKKVHFRDGVGSKAASRMILLHGRVARALGIQTGDLVVTQFQGQTKRQFYKATVDDRASFNVVIEADWKDIVDSYSKSKSPGMRFTSKNMPLRRVDLKLDQRETDTASQTDDNSVNPSQNARFLLTPSDGLRHGILYFDGAEMINPSKGGLVAGTGFCIYSCQYRDAEDEEDESAYDYDDDSTVDGSAKNTRPKMPSKCTELVSSFRYIGRPFCSDHAEYSALIEGLEWLFRFQFDRVTIVGAPTVVKALDGTGDSSRNTANKKIDRHNQRRLRKERKKAKAAEIPQLQRAAAIAQGMIDKAIGNGLEIDFQECFQDEQWEATELAEKALKEENNECQVMWDYVCEARAMDLKEQRHYEVQSSLTYSDDSETRRKNSPGILRACSSESWSLLKGEDVLDSDFLAAAANAGPLEKRARSASCDSKDDTCSTELTNNIFKNESFATMEETPEHRDESQTVEKETEAKVDVAEQTEARVNEDQNELMHDRGSARWRSFTKALKYRRNTNNKYTNINSQSDAESEEQSSVEDEHSTWMATTPTTPVSTFNLQVHSYDNRTHTEEKVDDTYRGAKYLEATSSDSASDASVVEAPQIDQSRNMCHFLDLDLLQGAQSVADDVKRLFIDDDLELLPKVSTTTTTTSADTRAQYSEYETLRKRHETSDTKQFAYV